MKNGGVCFRGNRKYEGSKNERMTTRNPPPEKNSVIQVKNYNRNRRIMIKNDGFWGINNLQRQRKKTKIRSAFENNEN